MIYFERNIKILNFKFQEVKPYPNPDYHRKEFGCGSYGMNFDLDKMSMYGFNDCCYGHDLCYAKCNNERRTCDSTFKECLLSKCQINSDNWFCTFSILIFLNHILRFKIF